MMTTMTPVGGAETDKIVVHARATLRASAVVAALLGCLGAPAISFPATAEPFQQYANASCVEGSCLIRFAVTPTGKRLEIYDASCYLRMNGAHELARMELIVGADEHRVVLAPELVEAVGLFGTTSYAASHSIFAYAREAEQFTAFAAWQKGAVGQFACHISGELLDAAG